MRKALLKYYLAALTVIFLFPSLGFADVAGVPGVIHYQAHLMNSSGANFDEEINAEVWIYNSAADGADRDLISENLLYVESHERIRVDRGTIRLSIGEGRALGRFAGTSLPLEKLAQVRELFIQLYLNGEKISPRQHIGYQNHALKAEYARAADNLSGTLNIPASSIPSIDASKTYDVIPPARIPAMDASKISGTVYPERIPSLSLDRLASGTLGNSVIGSINSSNITAATLPLTTMPDTLMMPGSIYFEAGDASDGQRISIPPDFRWPTHLLTDCDIIVGIKNFTISGGPWADEISVYPEAINLFGIPMGYEVHCGVEHSGGRTPCTTSYLMACVNYGN